VGAVVGTFLIMGGFALMLLVLSLFGGQTHLGHLHIGHLHIGHLHVGHSPATGHGGIELSMPVIAGFLGAFGFGGAIVASLLPGHGAATLLAAIGAGLAAAVPTAWLVGRLINAALNISTDGTLTSADLLGAIGVVITPVPADGYGEVRLAVGGQQMKFNARSDQPLTLGTQVFVISVPSPTSVLVEPTTSLR
jgi:membrane protein implicated in regulation of membrane protease activity